MSIFSITVTAILQHAAKWVTTQEKEQERKSVGNKCSNMAKLDQFLSLNLQKCWFAKDLYFMQTSKNFIKHFQRTELIRKRWLYGPCQANLVLIAYASSEGSGEPAHPRSLARTFAARSYKQWVKRNLQTGSQIPGPSEWLGMRS